MFSDRKKRCDRAIRAPPICMNQCFTWVHVRSESWLAPFCLLYIEIFTVYIWKNDRPIFKPELKILFHTAYLRVVCGSGMEWQGNLSYSVNTGNRFTNISDINTRKRRNMIGIDMIQSNRIAFRFAVFRFSSLRCVSISFLTLVRLLFIIIILVYWNST